MAKKDKKDDIADKPMKGNRLSPKEIYKAIREDEEMAKRKDVRGSNMAAAIRLRRDSEEGRYANPEFGGDLGQFLMSGGNRRRPAEEYKKGGKVSASKRADGCVVRGKTKGKIR